MNRIKLLDFHGNKKASGKWYSRNHSLGIYRGDIYRWDPDKEEWNRRDELDYDNGDPKDFAMILRREQGVPKRLVDLGCGSARLLHQLAPHYPASEFHGIDYAASDLNQGNVHIRQGDLEKRLPFDDDYFDFTVSDCVLSYLADKLSVLSEAVRITKPGGIVAVYFPLRRVDIERDELVGIIESQTDSLEVRDDVALLFHKKGPLAFPFKLAGFKPDSDPPYWVDSHYEDAA